MVKTATTHAHEFAQIEKVYNHSPIKGRDGETSPECWAAFAAEFKTVDGIGYLQPGQFVPLWSIHRGMWKLQTPFELHVTSAYVRDGRYMVAGGNGKVSSHPKISEWDEANPMPGLTGQLLNPGGLRTIKPGNMPTLISNESSAEKRNIDARKFHADFREASLNKGCPIQVVCRSDRASVKGIPFTANVMYDILRQEATSGYSLPLPIITSNQEKKVLHEYPEWEEALEAFCAKYEITEIGVLYAALDVDDIDESISNDPPNRVYRNAIVKGDLGFSTLDPNLYERMLPFATGSLDEAFLPRM